MRKTVDVSLRVPHHGRVPASWGGIGLSIGGFARVTGAAVVVFLVVIAIGDISWM